MAKGGQNIIDLTGQVFGRLKVISKAKSDNAGRSRWNCICTYDDNEITVIGYNLTHGLTKSCGCLKHEKGIIRRKRKVYDKSKERLRTIWKHMKERCYNSNNTDYIYYGDKGVKICQEWLDDFMNFYNLAMANDYADNLSIDRINGNGNYEPSNCRWVSMTIQARNREVRKNSISGINCISFNKEKNKWQIGIGVNGKRIHLGYRYTLEEAIQVRKEAEIKYWGVNS